MSTGSYGVVKPADISPDDVEIYYTYSPSRDVEPVLGIQQLNPNSVLKAYNSPNLLNGSFPIFGGLYNLRLPSENFSNKGIYTIVIRPKQIFTKIQDCGVLSSFPDIKGIVLDSSQLPSDLSSNNGLIGYRIEYYNSDGSKQQKLFKIVTSSNRVEPVNQNLQNTTQKSIRYRINDSSSLIFCTLTPSSASSVRPNEFPFIGSPGQDITITNTFFNPIMLEVEMVEYDSETLAYGIYGNQTKSIQDGVYTVYDFNNNIYKQWNLFEIQNETDQPLYEGKQNLTVVDTTKDFNNIINTNI